MRNVCLRSVGRGAPTAKKRALRPRRSKLHHQSRPILSSHQVMVSHWTSSWFDLTWYFRIFQKLLQSSSCLCMFNKVSFSISRSSIGTTRPRSYNRTGQTNASIPWFQIRSAILLIGTRRMQSTRRPTRCFRIAICLVLL